MSIDKIQQQFFQQSSRNHVLHLREGQIVEGKIEQLYTDDKAKVRIGNSPLIAQIETALSVGESYYFQVNEQKAQVYLQVVQGAGVNRAADLDTLLTDMQIKSSKVNREFVNDLISRGIPFNRSELEQALQILNKQTNKADAREVLQKMFQVKLPITDNVFQAYTTFNTTNFSTILKEVYHSLQQNEANLTNEEAKLMELIQSFIHRPQAVSESFTQLLLSQVNHHSQFSMLQMMGFLDENVSQEQLIAYLGYYIQSIGSESFPLQYINNDTQLQQLMSEVKTDITTLLQQQPAITRAALTSLNIFHQIQSASLSEQEFSSLIKMMERELLPLLPEKMDQQLANRLEKLTLQDQPQLNDMLKTISNHQVYSQLANFSDAISRIITEETSPSFYFREALPSSILNLLTLESDQNIQYLIRQRSTITETITQLMHTHDTILNSSMNEREFTLLVRTIEQELLPLLPKQIANQITPILKRFTVEHQSSVLHFLQALASDELYTSMANQTQATSQFETFQEQSVPIQQQLLAQITQYMQSIGLTLESDMMQAMQNVDQNNFQAATQTDTIKSLLLHMIQQGGQQSEQMQQLVHFINGLQLQSLTETNQMIQAQLYLPGNPFALNDDIFIKFESKKTKNEKIDADYCRIIFMLDLEQLRETIIDMQVQKRIITVTIFNDLVSETSGMESMKQSMSKNLQDINYHLSIVDWKPLSKQNEASSKHQPKQNLSYKQEGFDLKI